MQPEDAEELYAVVDRNRTRLMRWLPWATPSYSLPDVRQFLALHVKENAEGSTFTTVIRHRGAICGCIGLHRIDRLHRNTSIGYWIDEAHEGKGITTAACRAMITAGFRDFALHRIEIRCATWNHRSSSIPANSNSWKKPSSATLSGSTTTTSTSASSACSLRTGRDNSPRPFWNCCLSLIGAIRKGWHLTDCPKERYLGALEYLMESNESEGNGTRADLQRSRTNLLMSCPDGEVSAKNRLNGWGNDLRFRQAVLHLRAMAKCTRSCPVWSSMPSL